MNIPTKLVAIASKNFKEIDGEDTPIETILKEQDDTIGNESDRNDRDDRQSDGESSEQI